MTPMTMEQANRTGEEVLHLRSRLEDLVLIPQWIASLASHYMIPGNTQYAMNLCLEEVVSNIIRHGYGNAPDRPILVRYTSGQDHFPTLVVDDEAPRFNPLAFETGPIEEVLDPNHIGGLGIHLLRCFATAIEYESTSSGNRLRMSFSTAG
jgi:serine/threonine-protein kinase RsbW